MSITVVSAKKVYAAIEDLPEIMGIGNGDRFIVQTADGTALLDYENIRIDLDHTTFGTLITDMQEFQAVAESWISSYSDDLTTAKDDIATLRTDTNTIQQQVEAIKMLLKLVMGIHAGDSEEAITLDKNTLEQDGQNLLNEVYGEVMDKDYQFSLTTHNLRSLAIGYDDGQTDSIAETVEELKQSATTQDELIADILTTMSTLIPIGTVVPFIGNDPPQGWLLCNGQEVSQQVYPLLYNMLIQNNNFKTNTGNAHVPDLRGYFIRGRDESRTIGSYQGSGVPNITGGFPSDDQQGKYPYGAFFYDASRSGPAVYNQGTSGFYAFDASRISGVYQNGLGEVRPANMALNYIIRAAYV